MNATEFSNLLISLGACEEAREWAAGKDLATVWQTCERGDWLLWLCGRMLGKDNWPTRQQVVLAACPCAEKALKYVPAGELRPAKAIETARQWTRGEATIQEVRDAAYAATYAAYAATYVAYVAYAAYAAANAAYATYVAYAADAAYVATYAAANAAAYAADAAARKESLKESADIIRSVIHLNLEAL